MRHHDRYDVPSVAFSRRNEEWTVRGEPRRSGVHGELVLAPEELASIQVVDLRSALKAECACYGTDSAEVAISAADGARSDCMALGCSFVRVR